MAAPIIPCASAGEISDALRRVESFLAQATFEAEAIRGALNVAEPWQRARAAELRAEAASVATILAGVSGAAFNPRQQEAA